MPVPALLYSLLSAPFGWLATAFWIWMLVDCLKNGSGRDRQWIWLLVFLNVLGAAIYFVVCWWPRSNRQLPMPGFARRFAVKDKLWQAEADARNIGKAYQFVKLGDLRYSVGDRTQAQHAYDQAIAQEPESQQALWGLVNLAADRKDLAGARERLTLLLQEDPGFKYGEASALYGQLLYELGELDEARTHLEANSHQNGTPEAALLLAQLQQQQGDREQAKETVASMVAKVKGSPPYYFKQHRGTVRRAERLMRMLEKS